ncbi:MAG: Hsp20/alpha crystallin family protein [Proteobacteria bacterium]|nr:Hsp20/alpha crystallin family protein [Pseudomonadota bacterium]
MGKKKVFGGLGGIFDSVANLADKLSELSEKESIFNTSEFESDNGKIKGNCGINIRFGANRSEPSESSVYEPSPQSQTRKTAAVWETREPLTDVMEEDDYLLIVVEMPGLEKDDAVFELNRDILIVKGEKDSKKFYKEILLPGAYSSASMEVNCNNGIFEIRCR